ncbi:40S ribosomal protein S8 [Linum perenne]
MYRYELGRQPANTKLSSNKTVRRVRVRGGNVKWRALRLDTGNFSWGSEAESRKARLLDVVYNASNNELVRTQTLVKGAIVQVDAAPFKLWYQQHYGVDIGRKKKTTAAAAAKKEGEVRHEAEAATEEAKKSSHVTRKLEKRQQTRTLDAHIEEQFGGGRLLACISSRPGQCGRADGYVRLSHLLQLLGQIYGIYYDVCVYSFDIKKLFPCWLAGTYWRAKSWSCT